MNWWKDTSESEPGFRERYSKGTGMKRLFIITCALFVLTPYPPTVSAFELDTSVRVVRDLFGTSHEPGSAVEPGLNVELLTRFYSVLSDQFALVVQGERHTVTGNTLLSRIHVSEGVFDFGVGASLGILNSLATPAVPGFTALLRTNIGETVFVQAELIESLGGSGASYGQVDARAGFGVYNAEVVVFYDNRRAARQGDAVIRRTVSRYGTTVDVFKSGVPYGLNFMLAWRTESMEDGSTVDSLMGVTGGAGLSYQLNDALRIGLDFSTDIFLIGTGNLTGASLNSPFTYQAGAFVRYSALND